jgi:hypothetical protein
MCVAVICHEIFNIHTYHSRLILEGVAETSQILIRDTHIYQNDVTGAKTIAACRLIAVHLSFHHHHQPINVSTAGAQAFLMDYPQGERAITHHAGPVRVGARVCSR